MQELHLVMMRLRAEGGGIALFHDPKFETAAMRPALPKELKDQGYSVVHVVPTGAPPIKNEAKATEFSLEKSGKTTDKHGKRNIRADASLYSFRLTFGS